MSPAETKELRMLLSVENLRKTFLGEPVLHGIDLKVEKGDVVAIIGPSGS